MASEAEARLSAMAMFIDVARGSDSVAQRLSWLEPFLDRDQFVEYIARGLLAEHAYWQGDIETVLAQSEATVSAAMAWGGPDASRSSSGSPPCGWPPWPTRRWPPAPPATPRGSPRAVSEADRVIEFARAGGRQRRPARELARR